jgi:hypothetical protein
MTEQPRELEASTSAAARFKDSKEQRCYFLERLPRELRDQIYHHTFFQPNGVKIHIFKPNPSMPDMPDMLALTSTCKQIRQECGNLFFEVNELILDVNLLTAARSHIQECRRLDGHPNPNFADHISDHFAPVAGHHGCANRFKHVRLLLWPHLFIKGNSSTRRLGVGRAIANLLLRPYNLRVALASGIKAPESEGPPLAFTSRTETIAALRRMVQVDPENRAYFDPALHEEWIGQVFDMKDRMQTQRRSIRERESSGA